MHPKLKGCPDGTKWCIDGSCISTDESCGKSTIIIKGKDIKSKGAPLKVNYGEGHWKQNILNDSPNDEYLGELSLY